MLTLADGIDFRPAKLLVPLQLFDALLLVLRDGALQKPAAAAAAAAAEGTLCPPLANCGRFSTLRKG
jgi:hypothetical protein